MAFKRRKYRMTNSIEVIECHAARHGAPGQPRQRKERPTPEAVRKNNQRNRERKCSRMVDKYFNEDDYAERMRLAHEQIADNPAFVLPTLDRVKSMVLHPFFQPWT